MRTEERLTTVAGVFADSVQAQRALTDLRSAGIDPQHVSVIAKDRERARDIAQETGAKIGGALYSDALSERDGPAATYIDMMRNNVRELTRALTS